MECGCPGAANAELELMALRELVSDGADCEHSDVPPATSSDFDYGGYGDSDTESNWGDGEGPSPMACDEDATEGEEEDIMDLDEEELERLAEQVNKSNPSLKIAMEALLHGYRRGRIFRHRNGGCEVDDDEECGGEAESDAAADRIYQAMLRADGGQGKTYEFEDFGEHSQVMNVSVEMAY